MSNMANGSIIHDYSMNTPSHKKLWTSRIGGKASLLDNTLCNIAHHHARSLLNLAQYISPFGPNIYPFVIIKLGL